MRDDKAGRVAQGRSADEAAKTAAASRSSSPTRKPPVAEVGGADDFPRLIEIIARQAAREAFRAFKEALDAGAVRDAHLFDRLNHDHPQVGQQGNERVPPEPGERLLSVADVAGRLGVAEKTVRRKISAGDLPALRVGKLIRVRENTLTVYLTRARSAGGV
jgi:excisionase family DNA binding protein